MQSPRAKSLWSLPLIAWSYTYDVINWHYKVWHREFRTINQANRLLNTYSGHNSLVRIYLLSLNSTPHSNSSKSTRKLKNEKPNIVEIRNTNLTRWLLNEKSLTLDKANCGKNIAGREPDASSLSAPGLYLVYYLMHWNQLLSINKKVNKERKTNSISHIWKSLYLHGDSQLMTHANFNKVLKKYKPRFAHPRQFSMLIRVCSFLQFSTGKAVEGNLASLFPIN